MPTSEGGARVVIRVLGQTVTYSIPNCPISVWLGPSLDDGLDFGSYPTGVWSGRQRVDHEHVRARRGPGSRR